MSDFRHDPNQVPNNIEVEIPSYLKWIYGGVGAVLLGGLLLFAFTNDRGSQTASNQIVSILTPMAGAIPITAPRAVATPLPPWKARNTEYRWPRIAASATMRIETSSVSQ